jgi:transposase
MNENTPEESPQRVKYDTLTRVRFYKAFDSQSQVKSLRQICKDENIPSTTGRRWIRQRQELGEIANRRTRRASKKKLGRPKVLEDSQLERIASEYREAPYDAIVDKENIPLTSHSLQQNFSTRLNSRRYRKPRTNAISHRNEELRIRYGNAHKAKTITGWWQYIYFTDEVHFNSQELSTRTSYILRSPSSQDRLSNLQESNSSSLNVTIRVSAGISHNHKGPLLFYNDPADPASPRAYKRRRPRRGKHQTDQNYANEVAEYDAWLASQAASEDKKKPKGNSMTLELYANEVLPSDIKHIEWLESHYRRQFFFQEDNDPSHAKRTKDNAAYRLKQASHLALLIHPPQSPDLNPVESIWQIIKQRIRGRTWEIVEDFKLDIQAEWRRITLKQVRKRISEMPRRCSRVVELQGKGIQSNVW